MKKAMVVQLWWGKNPEDFNKPHLTSFSQIILTSSTLKQGASQNVGEEGPLWPPSNSSFGQLK